MTRRRTLTAGVAAVAALGLLVAVSPAVLQDDAGNGIRLAGPTGDDALEVVRTGPKEILAGNEFQYDLKVTNLTNAPINGVQVTETVSGLELRSADFEDARVQPDSMTASLGTLAGGETKTVTVTARPGKVGDARSCITAEFNPTLCTVYKVVKPDLELAWTLYAERDVEEQCPIRGIYACDDLFVVYKLVNTGNAATEPVTLTQELPGGVMTGGKKQVSLKLPGLRAGQEIEKRVPLTINRDQVADSIAFAAEARAGNLTASTDENSVNVLKPALDVKVDLPSEVLLKKRNTGRVTVTNTGNAPALDTVLMMDGADGLLLDDREYDVDRGLVIGCLQPGQSRTVNLGMNPTEEGEATVKAMAEAYCVDAVEAMQTVKFKGISAILIEVVDKKDPVPVGENTVYEINVKNQGSAPDLNVQLTATLPQGETYVSGRGDSKVTVDGNTVNFGKLPDLAPGAVATWYVEVKAESAQKAEFVVELTSDANPDPVTEQEPTTLY